MSNIKISDMTPGSALGGTELLEMVQGGATRSTTPNAVRTQALTCPVILTGVVGSSALTLTGATQVASFPVLTATQTWNNAGVTFTAWKLNVTSTASAAGSLLLDLQTGGVSQFSVGKAGAVSGASLALGGATIGSNALAVTGLALLTGTATITGGTVTVSTPVISATQTWNDGAVTFNGLFLNVTSTASAAASKLIDLQVGGVTQFNVTKAGLLTVAGGVTLAGALAGATTGVFSGILTMQSGQVGAVRVVVAAGAITVTTADYLVVVNKTVGAASAVALPAGVTGQAFVIKDGKGDANANNITITPAAGNIDGAGTLVMTVNYQAVKIQYNGTQWNVV